MMNYNNSNKIIAVLCILTMSNNYVHAEKNEVSVQEKAWGIKSSDIDVAYTNAKSDIHKIRSRMMSHPNLLLFTNNNDYTLVFSNELHSAMQRLHDYIENNSTNLLNLSDPAILDSLRIVENNFYTLISLLKAGVSIMQKQYIERSDIDNLANIKINLMAVKKAFIAQQKNPAIIKLKNGKTTLSSKRKAMYILNNDLAMSLELITDKAIKNLDAARKTRE